MSITKIIARKIVFPMIRLTNFDKVIRNRTQNGNLVLMFHGVSSKDTTWFSPRHLEVDHFEKIIAYLKKNFNVISAKEMLEMKGNSSANGRKNVSITFDDGYFNNYSLALPILEKYQVKATFFISTVCQSDADNLTLWADAITAIQKIGKVESIEINGDEYINGISKKGKHLFDAIKGLSCLERDRLLSELTIKYDLPKLLHQLDPEIWKMMSADELVKFAKSPFVEIGSHGHMHYNLGEIEEVQAIEDVNKSIRYLNEWLNQETDSIAYPDGSYSESLKTKLADLGVKYQFAVGYKFESDKSDKRIINRYGVSSTTTFDSNVYHINRAFQTNGF